MAEDLNAWGKRLSEEYSADAKKRKTEADRKKGEETKLRQQAARDAKLRATAVERKWSELRSAVKKCAEAVNKNRQLLRVNRGSPSDEIKIEMLTEPRFLRILLDAASGKANYSGWNGDSSVDLDSDSAAPEVIAQNLIARLLKGQI